LDIEGEHVYRLPSLSVPSEVDTSPERVEESEAVRLFVERAVARRSDFALNRANAAAVASVCRRLDGIPLAVELAAARVATFSIADLEARLDDRLRLLSAGRRGAIPRHQTLRALVDWSYELLTDAEQVLLRELSVFAGGFTLDAAETLNRHHARPALDTFGLVPSLVEKSLIQIEERSDPLRYGMLETIRQFAAEQLREHGDEHGARLAHVGVFLSLAESATPHLWKAERLDWLSRIDADEPNIREAMAFLLSDPDPEVGPLAMRLFIAMSRYWEMRGQAAYVLDVAQELLAHPGTLERDALWVEAVAALALIWRGDNWQLGVFTPVVTEAAELAGEMGMLVERSVLCWVLGGDLIKHGQLAEGVKLLERAIGYARRSGDLSALGVALIAGSASQTDTEQAQLSEALQCIRTAGDEYWEASILNNLACIDLVGGNRESARRLLGEGIALSLSGGTANILGTLLSNLGELELAERNIPAAQAAFAEAIAMQIRTGLLDHTSGTLIGGLAGCASARGDEDKAAFLYGAAHAVSDSAGIEHSDWVQQDEETLREKTSQAAFEAAFARGYALDPREALRAAQAWSDQDG
jgi:tetratricopeptide (TPR) repeat protein